MPRRSTRAQQSPSAQLPLEPWASGVARKKAISPPAQRGSARTSSTTEAPSGVSQVIIGTSSAVVGRWPVTLYQPKMFLKRAVPRLTTSNVTGQVGVKVSGVSAPSCHGSRPSSTDGMQVLSLTWW